MPMFTILRLRPADSGKVQVVGSSIVAAAGIMEAADCYAGRGYAVSRPLFPLPHPFSRGRDFFIHPAHEGAHSDNDHLLVLEHEEP